MIEILTKNLITIFHAMALLALSWFADFLLSTYRNVGILSQAWDTTRFFNSLKRLAVLIVGLVLLIVVITDFPVFINQTGIEIPSEYIEVFNLVSILLAILLTATRYTKGAIEAFFDILDYKKLLEESVTEITESGLADIIPNEVIYTVEPEEYVDDNYIAPKA